VVHATSRSAYSDRTAVAQRRDQAAAAFAGMAIFGNRAAIVQHLGIALGNAIVTR
jgi:hypothetical protein